MLAHIIYYARGDIHFFLVLVFTSDCGWNPFTSGFNRKKIPHGIAARLRQMHVELLVDALLQPQPCLADQIGQMIEIGKMHVAHAAEAPRLDIAPSMVVDDGT